MSSVVGVTDDCYRMIEPKRRCIGWVFSRILIFTPFIDFRRFKYEIIVQSDRLNCRSCRCTKRQIKENCKKIVIVQIKCPLHRKLKAYFEIRFKSY